MWNKSIVMRFGIFEYDWHLCILEQDKQFVPHALRHSFCSRLIAKGVGLPEVQLLMGHADISTSMIYMHLDPAKLASAVSALED